MMDREVGAGTSLLSSTEKTEHAKSRACSRHEYEEEAKMIENEPILSGSNADVLSSALSEVKVIGYKKAGAQLDDSQALDALVSYFLNAER